MPDDTLRAAALDYHRLPTPGKISVVPTKPMATQRDLSLAYSPGVAEACMAIAHDPLQAEDLTARGNLVAVVTNGTAVLGLGNIGPLAGKPVMEGKGCLFKKFAGIDVFDIELAETDVDAIVDTIARMEPTFGGINLEDIKAPDCFLIEKKLRERMKIPVFHDDQHGTAIVAAAALINALEVTRKDIGKVKVVVSGAGAAAIACLDLMVSLGLKATNVIALDSKGVIYKGRASVDESKARYAQDTAARTLADAARDADVFLGLSTAGVLTPDMVKTMAQDPIILAMANPDPEIRPEDAMAARPDSIIGTGRSDYPNQVNNVLCFPFIFRGALDCGATTINEPMKVAATRALARLAHAEIPEVVARAYGAGRLRFGREYLIPKPFDPRLIEVVAPAVAEAAMQSGVARRPIADMAAYRERLKRFVYESGSAMGPVFATAKRNPRRVLYAEGEDDRVLQAAQVVVDEGIAHPVLMGRPDVVAQHISEFDLRLEPGKNCTVIDPTTSPESREAAAAFARTPSAAGLAGAAAQQKLAENPSRLAAYLLKLGAADAMLCGTSGRRASEHLLGVHDVIGLAPGRHTYGVMQMLILPQHQLFITDTHSNRDPSAEEVAEIALLAADQVRAFGLVPRVALLSHSSFGSSDSPSAQKMRAARELIRARDPKLAVEGEMRGDAALSMDVLQRENPDSTFEAPANLLVMPNVESANIAYNLLRMAAGNGITVGGIVLGAARPVHLLTPSSTVRRIVNMTAVAVVDAATRARGA